MTDPGGVRPSDGGSRWSELRPLLDRAFDLPAAQRLPFLRQACDGDSELYAEAVALLEADADGGVDPLADGVHAMAPQLVQEALPEPEEEAPRRLGPYRLLSQLGAGGMGTVYLAERADQQFRQQVAIKLLHAERAPANLNRRFLNERQILAGLRHPHIARFLDGGVAADGSPYMVMELVEGEPIDRFCDRRRLGIEARLELFEQACDAVRYAHQNLVVHRDLKPSHVRVTDSGVVKLLDFGIAKNLDPERADDDPAATRTHLRQLTPRFASPEQILG
ncbi:MAG: serine/threonine-protein kinase, partial [Acidobacteriota bacterium]